MITKAYLLVGALAASGLCNAHTALPNFCSTPEPSKQQKQEVREQMAAAKDMSLRAADEIINVQTYFHVVASNDTVEGGYFPRQTLLDQMEQIHIDFAGTNVNFILMDIDWTVNETWARHALDPNMQKTLRKGGYDSLNIYFQGLSPLAVATFPGNVTGGSEDFSHDACYIGAMYLPGSSTEGFNQGKMTSHEIGHWLGLYHTFDGGCTGDGDEVDDTPVEERFDLHNDCPYRRDTCPEVLGLDPIHNHMTYTTDACRKEFTVGQSRRMHNAWYTFRHGN